MSMLRLFSQLVGEPLAGRARQFGFVREEVAGNRQPESSPLLVRNVPLGFIEEGSLGSEEIMAQHLQAGEGI